MPFSFPVALRRPIVAGFWVLGVVPLLGGCGALAEKAGTRFANNLSAAMLEHDDPEMVAAATPSYLLLLDALVRQSPDSVAFRQAAATLNSAYAGAFVKDPLRGALITDKALSYSLEAMCLADKSLCGLRKQPIEEFNRLLAARSKADVPLLYTTGAAWAGWIQTHSDDWNAVADLPRVEALMQRVIALDERYQEGSAHLYLGGLATVLPPALGGRPEVGKLHFEKAIALSGGRNLMAKVYYAKNYARGVFDRELHDRLLNEVLAAEAKAPAWTLSNRLAQQEARALLDSADEFF
ncbi:MAG: TRAP transporter TatT component family protein [Moraxellaceae bacterium]|nr:TRAP transporter TatT component family protein [Moraxellaceae bacterium]